MMSLVHVNKHLSRIGGIIIEVTVKNASHAGGEMISKLICASQEFSKLLDIMVQ